MLRMMLLIILIYAAGCERRQASYETQRSELVGVWKLAKVSPQSCPYGESIKDDRLILRPDGTMEQTLVFLDGRSLESHGQRWFLYSNGNVSLERRINVKSGQGTEFRSEGLVVHHGENPIMLIDPDSNCFYQRVANNLSK
jgi:hypothetical protein